ncbi:MAG: LuxR family transcriptional regulator [Leptolyngbya sp. PLA1]|nr:LuxR family transcriptional regulator [Leptolyngbya sp. PLA1]
MAAVNVTDSDSSVLVTMARAINASGRLQRLPGVPTPDWCERAAAALVVLVPDGGVVVGLGRLGTSGSVVEVVGAGAAIGPLAVGAPSALMLRSAFERPREFWWSAECAGPLWDWITGARLACASAPLEGGRAAMLVSAAAPTGAAMWEAALAKLMIPLTEASRLAFGDGTLRPSEWLSPREQDVLSGLIVGKSIREIAAESGRSAHTVHDHVKNLHRKLRANSRGELVARALGHAAAWPPAGGPGER